MVIPQNRIFLKMFVNSFLEAFIKSFKCEYEYDALEENKNFYTSYRNFLSVAPDS